MSEQGLESRVEELETRISFQERQIDELNELLYQQQQQLDQVIQWLRKTNARLESAKDTEISNPPPPHY